MGQAGSIQSQQWHWSRQISRGSVLQLQKGDCSYDCDDAKQAGSEQCDDGNLIDGDAVHLSVSPSMATSAKEALCE